MNSIAFKKEIWDILRSMRECMESAFLPMLEAHGLTMMQTRILLEIKQCEHPTVGCLCGVIGLSSGNASSMCKKLEKAGFVKRIRDPRDERFVDLSLTEKGEETIREIEIALEKKYGQYLESRSELEVRELIAGIKKLGVFIQAMSAVKEQNGGNN